MVLKTERTVADVMDTEGDERRCCLCMDNITVWAIGKCKHPVCYICSSRMRVLGGDGQKDCAICKQTMEQVVFHDSYFDFDSINLKSLKKLKDIYFFTDDSYKLYVDLQRDKCPICHDFRCESFSDLKRHMSKKHSLFACELCVEHYLLFPGERKWYTRPELATHKRKGDADDKSHKGHPACTFCDQRFLDDHELYRHLRRDHHLCHICEADEGSRDFIENVQELVSHFRRKHFLCEHPNCKDDPLTAVFRSELDLKIHVADTHGGIDKRDLRIEVGTGHRDHVKRQQEIEYEISQMVNQPLPNVQDQESFPSLGKKSTNLMATSGPKKSKAQTSYRSLSSKNINSNEDFPSLGGSSSAPTARSGPNWTGKVKQNNKPVTTTKTKVPLKTSSYIPSNPASSQVPSESTNWSAEPERFVEKSQLQIREEKEAAKRFAKHSNKAGAPKKEDFPTLGGSGPKPSQFWGVPGSSIPKSRNNTAKKVVSAGKPKPGISNKKTKVDPVGAIVSSFGDTSLKNKFPPQCIENSPVSAPPRPAENSASDMAQRMTGGQAGWSAAPEVFKERSLLEIADEQKKHKNKQKKQPVPKQNDFPSLGGGGAAKANAFWGTPGNSIPKSNNKKKPRQNSDATKKTPQASKNTKVQNIEPVIQPISFDVPKPQKEKVVLAGRVPNEAQNASILAHRMTGGASGWSAPPDVFHEKSLLEIEEEKRKSKSQCNQPIPKIDDSAFPTLGGKMSKEAKVNLAFEFRSTKSYSKKYTASPPPVLTPSSGSAAEILRKAKDAEKEQIIISESTVPSAPATPEELEIVLDNEDFPAMEESEEEFVSAPEDDDDESDTEDQIDMKSINERLMAAINKMKKEDQDTFKISSGKFRTGGINAEEYIQLGCLLMEKKPFFKLLPDLLRTLPEGKHKDALSKAKKQLE